MNCKDAGYCYLDYVNRAEVDMDFARLNLDDAGSELVRNMDELLGMDPDTAGYGDRAFHVLELMGKHQTATEDLANQAEQLQSAALEASADAVATAAAAAAVADASTAAGMSTTTIAVIVAVVVVLAVVVGAALYVQNQAGGGGGSHAGAGVASFENPFYAAGGSRQPTNPTYMDVGGGGGGTGYMDVAPNGGGGQASVGYMDVAPTKAAGDGGFGGFNSDSEDEDV